MSSRSRRWLGDLSGAVADLGTFVPLVAALVTVNGLNPSAVLLIAGAVVIYSGAWFGIPFPVQPLKALAAIAIAQQVAPEVIHAAGLEIGLILLLLSFSGLARIAARAFTRPVVRALQVGVGLLLVSTAARLISAPPTVFADAQVFASPQIALPHLSLPSFDALRTALFLLVLPQLPLTFGNAVVATGDVARRYFGERAKRVTPSAVCVSAGLANIVSATVGGTPVCHGAGGMTAHYRLGAKTAWMNVGLGSAMVILGLFFGESVLAVFGSIPIWMLATLLAYTGVRHAALVLDLKGVELAIALLAGLLGAATGDLMITAGVALAAAHAPRLLRRRAVEEAA